MDHEIKSIYFGESRFLNGVINKKSKKKCRK